MSGRPLTPWYVQFIVHGSSNDGLYGATIGWMVHSVAHRDGPNLKGIDSIKAGNIKPIQARVGALLMVRVDAASGAEVVLGSMSTKLIKPQSIGTSGYPEVRKRHGRHDRALAATQGTIAAPDVYESVWEMQFKFNSPAMTGRRVAVLYDGGTDRLDHSSTPDSAI